MTTTLVSLYPGKFSEFVPFFFPASYKIPASDGQIPEVLTIEDAFYTLETMPGRPPIKVTVTSAKLAYSLIDDFKKSSIYVDNLAYPAVFFVEGRATASEVLSKYSAVVNRHIEAQNRWLRNLVKIADDEWQRFRQHRMITDMQRQACRILKLDREWSEVEIDTKHCPNCGKAIRTNQAVCECRCIVNPELYKKLQFAGE